jgi:hypothetical protein
MTLRSDEIDLMHNTAIAGQILTQVSRKYGALKAKSSMRDIKSH